MNAYLYVKFIFGNVFGVRFYTSVTSPAARQTKYLSRITVEENSMAKYANRSFSLIPRIDQIPTLLFLHCRSAQSGPNGFKLNSIQ